MRFPWQREKLLIVNVPDRWTPNIHDGKLYWFWTPDDWLLSPHVSPECCLTRRSRNVLMEVTVLEPTVVPSTTNPAAFVSGITKQSIRSSHPYKRIIRDEPRILQRFDTVDAFMQMRSRGILDDYPFVSEMVRPQHVHLLMVRYMEAFGALSITDCYSISRGNLVMQLNIKTLSSIYARQRPIFEQVVATVMLGRLE